MTPEDQKYYETILDMFQHPGWKLIKEDLDKLIDAAERATPDDCSTVEELHIRKGNLQSMRWFARMQTVTEHNYEQLQEQANGSSV